MMLAWRDGWIFVLGWGWVAGLIIGSYVYVWMWYEHFDWLVMALWWKDGFLHLVGFGWLIWLGIVFVGYYYDRHFLLSRDCALGWGWDSWLDWKLFLLLINCLHFDCLVITWVKKVCLGWLRLSGWCIALLRSRSHIVCMILLNWKLHLLVLYCHHFD